MKQRERKTRIVITMITVALAGLVVVQGVLLSIAWNLKDQAFQRNVITALSSTVQNLQKGEVAGDALEVIYRIGGDERIDPYINHFEFHQPPPVREMLRTRSLWADSATIDIEAHFPEAQSYAWSTVRADSQFGSGQMTFIVGEERTEFIHRIVDDLIIQSPRPISERLDSAEIDSLLRFNLDAVGIDLEPAFGVIASRGDSLVLVSEERYRADDVQKIRKSPFRSRLFPMDLVPGVYEIALHFPGQRSFLMNQIWPLLAASVLFMAVIVVAFIMTLGTVQQQHRFAARLIDFINNMTHEFKTPISTVSLASEAIGRGDIAERPEALQRYNRMIRDENLRMRRQVEKILQIAQLETGDFQLNLTPVDIHELASDTAEAFELQIEKRGGKLDLDLQAAQVYVLGDPVHLGNVLANLIDNAIKYSPQAPEIRLSTSLRGNQVILEVRDHGIGIDRQDHARVFEKYYRCPTGDRHDVKGFGLGLSFVRLLVEAHRGTVVLDSAPERGTRVVLSLPLDNGEPRTGRIR